MHPSKSHLLWLREQERGFPNHTHYIFVGETGETGLFASQTFRVGIDFMVIKFKVICFLQ